MIRLPYILSISMLMILTVPEAPAIAEVTSSFRYPLSNFSGPVRSQWARLAVDRERNEVYALDRHNNDIRIFDEHGMEIYVFGEDFTSAADIAIGNDGDIFILTARYRESTVYRCDYRGEKASEIPIRNIPAEFAGFRADRIAYREGSLYLADSNRLIVIVADVTGSFKSGYDLRAILTRFSSDEGDEGEKKKMEEVAINGFAVDDQGNILFSVPSLFAAFRLSPDGELVGFGRAGSGRGKFGVVAGITADEKGYIYVSDRLRCVVLVFDRELRFKTEFGYRGAQPSNLIVPDDVDIDGEGNVYVAQAANRGVSVFRIAYVGMTEEGQPGDLGLESTPTRGESPGEHNDTRMRRD